MNPSNTKTITVTAQWKSNCPSGTTCKDVTISGTTFDYTGNVQVANLIQTGYYKFEVWGAQGGYTSYSSTYTGYGGYGGYSYGNIYSSSNSAVYVVVGQFGITCPNTTNDASSGKSYNGGGWATCNTPAAPGIASGGGATHISTVNCGELKNCSAYQGKYDSSLQTYDGGNILIVAGGRGGQSGNCAPSKLCSGNGGGYIGGSAYYNGNTNIPTGGTQNGAGATNSPLAEAANFGLGASAATGSSWSGGGGGGWYGGGAGNTSKASPNYGGGAGGSGYIGNSLLLSDKGMYQSNKNQTNTSVTIPCTSSTMVSLKTICVSTGGAHLSNTPNTGNGYAKITYLGTTK